MAISIDCKQNIDSLKLVHEGTRQDQRFPDELNPAYAPVDERQLEHALVFAKTYSKYLKFYGINNTVAGDWTPFFSRDVSLQLAIAAIQDVDYYKSRVKASFDFLNNRSNDVPLKENELKQHLGYLFSIIATLAKQLDALKDDLPSAVPLKPALQNLIKNQLANAFERLIAAFKGGKTLAVIDTGAVPVLQVDILGGPAVSFESLLSTGLSGDWSGGVAWITFQTNIIENTGIYGDPLGNVFDKTNHIATHNLFTGIFDQFLKVYARTTIDARQALQQTLTGRDDHEPHYVLFLSFLRLFDYVRTEANTLTARHLDFYYRDILKLKEKPAEPGHAHLLIELAKQADSHEIAADELFKAGKDDLGIDVFFANDLTFIANKAKVAELKTVYRHTNFEHDSLEFENGRLFASPVANSDDGLGAKLTSTDQSWQPFFNKIYSQGELIKIRMPKAEIGFAIASHYLLLAEGTRIITLRFTIDNVSVLAANHTNVDCFVTTEKGWLKAEVTEFSIPVQGQLRLKIKLDGADPAITPYVAKTHGFNFSTDLPVLLFKPAHRDKADFLYSALQAITVQQIDLDVDVQGLKTLAVSNDFGPVDTAKPFQPFGATPAKSSSLVIGSREAFQKKLSTCTINVVWQVEPKPYTGVTVTTGVDFLQDGQWQSAQMTSFAVTETQYTLDSGLAKPVKPFIDLPDLSEQDFFNTTSRHGYARLKISSDFGQSQFEQALVTYIANVINKVTPNPKPVPPVGPFITQITLDYTATQNLVLNINQQGDFEARPGFFFHLSPFGYAEQHRFLKTGATETTLYLLPQFKHLNSPDKISFDKKLPAGHPVPHEAEFYIGVTDLKPPQNLALFFQVADGTADPLSEKPDPHIHWSYLRNNEWISFAENTVQDSTSELLNSGIITFSIPDDASSTNTLLASGQHWLRAAVAGESDTVCRLQMVASQGLTATFNNQGNDPAFPAKMLPAGTIGKLQKPVDAIKDISQPFASFGGRGAEQANAFYTRISERLRHKERAIALWDYEHLLLEAFPQIYQAKCLNHTHYEPDASGDQGIYRELAPGHITIVTIPNQQFHNLRDPLRPFTSLGLLEDIKTFLQKRLSCFVELHVKNPQFEEVSVAFKVRFHTGFDETFHVRKLQDAITRFLSPWAFADGGRPVFGGKIYQSVLLNFVEEQPYVDYVADFKLLRHLIINGELVKQPEIEIEGTKAVSILVSVPADQHDIKAINPAEVQSPGTTCPCESV
ncbi:MAG: baseplate J/gp47 family protein [Methylococcaceae bacterium]